jgi:hypothetical protein
MPTSPRSFRDGAFVAKLYLMAAAVGATAALPSMLRRNAGAKDAGMPAQLIALAALLLWLGARFAGRGRSIAVSVERFECAADDGALNLRIGRSTLVTLTTANPILASPGGGTLVLHAQLKNLQRRTRTVWLPVLLRLQYERPLRPPRNVGRQSWYLRQTAKPALRIVEQRHKAVIHV